MLVCVGTVLFFYALSGFLLKFVQMIKPLYLRGLNMFTLRQLGAKVNTTFASLSVVCIVLFLAITSVCGGIGIRNAIDGSLDRSTDYSASVSTSFGSYNAEAGFQPADLGAFGEFAERQGYDMAAGLRGERGRGGGGRLRRGRVRHGAGGPHGRPVRRPGDGRRGARERPGAGRLRGRFINSGYGVYPVYVAALSQVNDALALAGKPALELGAGECAIYSDSDITSGFYRDAVDRGTTLPVGGRDMRVVEFRDDCCRPRRSP